MNFCVNLNAGQSTKKVSPRLFALEKTTAFELALRNGNVTIVQYLFSWPPLPSQEIMSSALHEAVRRGDIDMVKFLLQHTKDPNRKDSNGETALMIAAKMGQKSITELLLKQS